jgi:DNA (cytosine-5)-methyltransferase 1
MRLGAWVEREIVVDLFAGGGGASEGIARALGRHPDIAVDHDPAFITKHYGGVVGHGAERPLGTITTQDHHSLSVAFLDKMYGSARAGVSVEVPAATVTAGGGRGGGHLALVEALLDRHAPGPALVRVDGQVYAIADIGMRMLSPRELFRAQGFRDGYVIDPAFGGKPLIKTEQIAKAGNSVCPPVAEAIVRANLSVACAEAA